MAVLRMFMTSYFHHCRWWVGKYCTGWPDEHSNIQWTTQCSLSSQVHCASMWMMAITRKLHLLHFSRNEGMPSIPEKWSGRYSHLGPMWFPNAADFQKWGHALNSGNLASQAPPANKNVSFGGVKHKKVDQTIFFVKCIQLNFTGYARNRHETFDKDHFLLSHDCSVPSTCVLIGFLEVSRFLD